ncbi:MAG TPA: DinB family protein [Thermomicrobiales bacterium]|nr:DinB family protein [Thermomicrobiales bacterium]
MSDTVAMTSGQTISVENFKSALLFVLDETFDNVHGAYLDPGDSFFATLAEITAEQASRPVGASCASIAAQLNHVIFYIEIGIRYMQGENPGKQDWQAAWQLTEVSDSEWAGLIQRVRDRQQQLLGLIEGTTEWDNDDIVGGAFAMIAHTAYHLGQIREAMCVVRG